MPQNGLGLAKNAAFSVLSGIFFLHHEEMLNWYSKGTQNKIGREGGFLLVAEAVTQNPVNNNSISLLLPPYGSQQPQTSAKPLFPIEGWKLGWECHVGFEIVSFGLG